MIGLHGLGIAFDRKDNGLLLDTISTTGDDRQDLSAIRQIQPDREGPIGFESHGLAFERDVSAGIRDAVHDEFGIDIEWDLLPRRD